MFCRICINSTTSQYVWPVCARCILVSHDISKDEATSNVLLARCRWALSLTTWTILPLISSFYYFIPSKQFTFLCLLSNLLLFSQLGSLPSQFTSYHAAKIVYWHKPVLVEPWFYLQEGKYKGQQTGERASYYGKGKRKRKSWNPQDDSQKVLPFRLAFPDTTIMKQWMTAKKTISRQADSTGNLSTQRFPTRSPYLSPLCEMPFAFR